MNDMMSMMFGGGPSKEQVRLDEIERRLHNDQASKGYAEIQKFIDSNIKDVGGQFEAKAYVRVYLREACYLGSKVAEDLGTPPTLAALLTEKCLPLLVYALEDDADRAREDVRTSEFLQSTSKETPALTEHEINKLKVEAHELREKLKANETQGDCGFDAEDIAAFGQAIDGVQGPPKNWLTGPAEDEGDDDIHQMN